MTPQTLGNAWWDILLQAVFTVLGVVLARAVDRTARKRMAGRGPQSDLSRVSAVLLVEHRSPPNAERPSARRGSESADTADDNDAIIALLFVLFGSAVASAVFYVAHREVILTTLSALTLFGLAFLTTSAWLLGTRGFALPGSWRALQCGSVLYICAVPLHIHLLEHPVFDEYGAPYPQVLATFKRAGWSAASNQYGFEVVLFLGMQLLGVVVILATSLALVVCHLYLLAWVNVAADARGSRLWWWAQRKLHDTVFSRPGVTLFLVGLMTAASLLLVSGVVSNWANNPSPVPPSPATPTISISP